MADFHMNKNENVHSVKQYQQQNQKPTLQIEKETVFNEDTN